MAVPKKKQSKTRSAKRAANWKAKAPAVQRMPAVSSAEAASPGVRQLRLLRRPPGDRGRVARELRPVEAPSESLDRASVSRSTTRRAARPRSPIARTRSSTDRVTNERLEFLGDSVLGLVVTDMAYRDYPDLPEGSLAKLRAAIVNMTALADVARSLGLGDDRAPGEGRGACGGRDKSSILADALEAVFGAVYLDQGLDVPPSSSSGSSARGWRHTFAAKATATTRRSCRSWLRRSCARCRNTG